MTRVGTILKDLRQQAPLVHCITNYVAMNVAANTLLAIGASPAMVHTPEEASEFAAIASSLTVNIGTLSPHWVVGMLAAAKTAKAKGTSWVLDPVAHFATAYRRETVAALMAVGPTIVRGNASEILALSGGVSSGQGVDAGDAVSAAEEGASSLARSSGAVVIVTGEVDFVTDGKRSVRVGGGSDLMPRVTAMGCSLTGTLGAFCAVAAPFDASVAALVSFAVAGERAHEEANGPGSFAWRFLDQLAALTPACLDAHTKVVDV